MKKLFIMLFVFFSLPLMAAKVGQKAPDFNEVDASGKAHKLSDFKGKYVVLEWFNKDCPFVKKHYKVGNMQNLQKEFTKKGVVWISVISSAKGKQGYLTAQEAQKYYKEANMNSTAILIDDDGSMGKAYSAKVTPHMYIINPEGSLIYNGAIDDNDSSDSDDIAKSKNFVQSALAEAMAGKAVTVSSNKPYGCSVKY